MSKINHYRLAPLARQDLKQIWRYTAKEWSAAQAEIYVAEIERVFETLVSMPQLAPEFFGLRDKIRVHFHGNHVVAYKVQRDYVYIVRILAGRQNWRAALKTVQH